MNTTSVVKTGSPCGCGSGAAALTSGCGCGGGCGCGCDTCQSQAYVRPQFFAGQLLTEDDLQSLVDYVVGKNRLHNRYLFGDGVVCGLGVVCAPCKSGYVTVNPGYALDCCGNDIVVPCSTDLNVNQMVRQLMLKLQRGDCGDPCAKTASQAQNGSQVQNGVMAPPATRVPQQRYCLYIDYCGQPSDPISPYATGVTCGQAVCEPSRIQENFRFELRCPPPKEPATGIAESIRACIGDERTAEAVLSNQAFLKRYLGAVKEGLDKLQAHPQLAVDGKTFERMKEDTGALMADLVSFNPARVKDLDEKTLEPVLRRLLDLAADTARVRLHSDLRHEKGYGATLEQVENALRRALGEITHELIDKALASTLEREYARSLLYLTRELLEWPDGLRDEEELKSNVSLRMLAARAVFTRDMVFAVSRSLEAMRDWLVSRLDEKGNAAACAALCKINELSLPTPQASLTASFATANSLVAGGELLLRTVPEVLRSCLCNALLSPCQPCDDPGVLLACLTVQDCQVTEICNLERRFVLTGPNLRYWFPEIGWVGEAVEKWCCPVCKPEDDDTRDGDASLTRLVTEAAVRAPALTRVALSAILQHERGRAVEFEPISSFVGNEAEKRDKTAELQEQLEQSAVKIRNLERDYVRLQERVARTEAKRPVGGGKQ
jgi:hypothetical protein